MRDRCERGFSLLEVLVASAIALMVTLTAAMLAIDAQGIWRTDSARVDLQQRARVAADTLTRALRGAGLGPPAGPLVHSAAAILPRRTGTRGADPPNVARTDALTVIRMAADVQYGALLLDVPAGTSVLEIGASPGCQVPPCGLSPGMHVILLDGHGNHDVFTIQTVAGRALTVLHHGSGSAAGYPAGTRVIPVETSSYYLDPEARVLREYDGDASDLPVLDDVVEMGVEYFGEPRPPISPRPRPGEANCLYASDGAYHTVLMPVLAAPGGLAALTPDLLGDGPWCGTGANRFDADLLRVRRVRITLRLQAADPAVRGEDTARFRNPGSARRAGAIVPDATVIVDVTPQNLVPGW